VTNGDLWSRIAEDMADKPYKALGIDLLDAARQRREQAIDFFLRQAHRIETSRLTGLDVGKEVRERIRAAKIRNTLGRSVAALDAALRRNAAVSRRLDNDVAAHLQGLRGEADAARQKMGWFPAPCSDGWAVCFSDLVLFICSDRGVSGRLDERLDKRARVDSDRLLKPRMLGHSRTGSVAGRMRSMAAMCQTEAWRQRHNFIGGEVLWCR
jgi:hypothetical protein